MNIIILGSQGFIGTYLCNHFLKSAQSVYGADVLEIPANSKYHYVKVSRLSAQWEDLLKLTTFDICINAAGSGNVAYSVDNPVIDFEANTLDVMRILDALRKYMPQCKYIHISSAAVYGNPDTLPIKELAALQPISPYGFHKMMSEIVCKEYQQLYHLNIAIIRPFSIYGNGLRKQLLWDICNKLSNDNAITLFGNGNETRDFIHITDFVLLVEKIILSGNFNGEIYNAASGKQMKIKEVAAIFEKSFGTDKTIYFNGSIKQADPSNWQADITKIKELGYKPSANFNDGVNAYITWFNKLYATN